MHVLSEPTSSSSGAQMSGSPLSSGGLPTTMSGFPAAESTPRRAELQVLLALYEKPCRLSSLAPRKTSEPPVAEGAHATHSLLRRFLTHRPSNRSGSHETSLAETSPNRTGPTDIRSE